MKTARIMFVLMVATLFLLTACGGGVPAEPAPATEQPPVALPPTATEPPAPVEPPPAEPTQPQYAPFCQAAPAACEAPAVTLLDKAYCVNKWPYALLSVPAGTTYESLDPDMKCQDQLNADGTLRISCNHVEGKELLSYGLKVCNGACSAPALQMGTGQCPDGYGFDTANQCCSAPAPASEEGCVVYKVDIGACPLPQ